MCGSKKVKSVSIAVLLLILVVAFYLWVFHPFLQRGKTAHISVDDVTICLQNLTKDSLKYNSIFEEPFFSYLKELHDIYGCAITCYVFEKDGTFNIDQMPTKYSDEFKKNSSWLKFGFHGIRGSAHKPSNVNYNSFTASFQRCNKSISLFASEQSKASILRLDYYYATPGEIDFLIGHGINTLLSADDDRRSYSLPFINNNQLLRNNSICFEGIKYLRTNIRIENIDFPYFNILKNRNRDTLVIFTHEWKLDNLNKYKLKRTIKILKEQNYKFICE